MVPIQKYHIIIQGESSGGKNIENPKQIVKVQKDFSQPSMTRSGP